MADVTEHLTEVAKILDESGYLVAAISVRDCITEIGRLRAQNVGADVGSSAARDVLAERRRQVEAEGWTPEHDDTHDGGELAEAAACYAARGSIYYGATSAAPFMQYPRQGRNREATGPYLQVKGVWPFGEPIKRTAANRRRDLVKAGALILADIERIDRVSARANVGANVGSAAPR